MAIRLGVRSSRSKVYKIDKFDFINDKIDKFNSQYTEYDIWHTRIEKINVPQIEKRVKYFHLMYVPFFPVGTQWTLRKTDGKLYNISGFERKIEEKIKKQKPQFYYFTFPLILIISLLFYFLPDYYRANINKQEISFLKTDSYKRNEKEYLKSIENLDQKINLLSENDYVKIRNFGDYFGKKKFLKIIEINNDSIKYAIVIYNKQFGADNFNLFKLNQYYTRNKTKFRTKSTTKNILRNSYLKSYTEYYHHKINSKEFGDLFTVSNEKQFIEGIYDSSRPLLIKQSYGFGRGEFHINFTNMGAPVKLIKIENLENEIKWSNQIPEDIKNSSSNNDDTFTLKSKEYNNTRNLKYKVQLTFENSKDEKSKYIIEGKNKEFSVKEVLE